jgi:hypothetical protein
MSIPRTSIAGRHAADRLRAATAARAEAELRLERQNARVHLAQRLRAVGLAVAAECAEHPERMPTIAVNCRVDTCRADHALVYALLDETGWSKDPSRYARHNVYGDFVPLHHPTTQALCLLVVKVPESQVPQWETA